MSNADKVLQEINAAVELSQLERDMARSEWRQLKRPGVAYVDAGVLSDGTVELVHDDPAALKAVKDAILKPGRRVKHYELPKLTLDDFGAMYDHARSRGALRDPTARPARRLKAKP